MTMTVCLRSKENVMSSKSLLWWHRAGASRRRLVVLAIAFGVAGCHQTPLVDTNIAPLADAKVINMAGTSVDEKTVAKFMKDNPDAGMAAADMLRFDFNGQDVTVTLDGSQSSDEDGTVVKYQWLSGNAGAADAGGGRLGPDPEDIARPTVTVGEGTWRFVLWVSDNKGKVSEPDTVTFTVGKPPATSDPKVAACVADVIPSVPAACATCVCALGDTCRTAVAQKACGADCWGLIQCIGSKCPDYAKTMDVSCIVMNCMQFVAGGQMGAPAAGMCVVSCIDSCPAMAATGMDAGPAAMGTDAGN
jgi:hypothetical protein